MNKQSPKSPRSKPRPPKDANPRELTTFTITGVAGLLAFLSWVAQTVCLEETIARRANAVQMRDFIQSENAQAQQYLLCYQTELRREKPDKEMLLNCSVGFVEKTERILNAARNIDPDSKILSNHFDFFWGLRKPFDAAVSQREIGEIISTADLIMQYVSSINVAAERSIGTRLAFLERLESRWTWTFRIMFLMGSLVSAISWLIVYKSLRRHASSA